MSASKPLLDRDNGSPKLHSEVFGHISKFFQDWKRHHIDDHGMKQDTDDVPEVKLKLEKLSELKGAVGIADKQQRILEARKEVKQAREAAEANQEGYVYTLDSGYLYRFTTDDPAGHEACKNAHIELDEAEKLKWKRYRWLLNEKYKEKYSYEYNDEEILENAMKDYSELKKDPEVRRHSAKKRCLTVNQAKKHMFLTPLRIKLCYWIWPPIFGLLSYIFSIMMLHVATHYYINYMDAWQDIVNATNITKLEIEAGDNLDLKFNLQRIKDGQLWDSMDNLVRHQLGDKALTLPIAIMDGIAFVPGALYVLIFLAFLLMGRDVNLDIFTKTCFVGSCMAIFKGILDPITIMPDSSGWANCQSRLHPEGVALMRNASQFALWSNLIPTPSEIGQALTTEVLGLKTGSEGQRLHARYCADMLVSGHTYIATVCSFGVFKMVSDFLRKRMIQKGGDNLKWYVVKWSVFALCVLCVLIDVGSIAITKFHYTVDIIVALLMVMLLWDSAHLETAVACWTTGYRWRMVRVNSEKHDTLLTVCPPLTWFGTKCNNMAVKLLHMCSCGCIGMVANKHAYDEWDYECPGHHEAQHNTGLSGAANPLIRKMSDREKHDLLEERRNVPNLPAGLDYKNPFTWQEFIAFRTKDTPSDDGDTELEQRLSTKEWHKLLFEWSKLEREPSPVVICDSTSRKMINLVKVRRELEVFSTSSWAASRK